MERISFLIIGKKIYLDFPVTPMSNPLETGYREVGTVNRAFEYKNMEFLLWFEKRPQVRKHVEITVSFTRNSKKVERLWIDPDTCSHLVVDIEEECGLYTFEAKNLDCGANELRFLKDGLLAYPLNLSDNITWSMCKKKPTCPPETKTHEFASTFIRTSKGKITHIFVKDGFNPNILIEDLVTAWEQFVRGK